MLSFSEHTQSQMSCSSIPQTCAVILTTLCTIFCYTHAFSCLLLTLMYENRGEAVIWHYTNL